VAGEGRTDTEALLNLRKAIESRIRAGAKAGGTVVTPLDHHGKKIWGRKIIAAFFALLLPPLVLIVPAS